MTDTTNIEAWAISMEYEFRIPPGDESLYFKCPVCQRWKFPDDSYVVVDKGGNELGAACKDCFHAIWAELESEGEEVPNESDAQ